MLKSEVAQSCPTLCNPVDCSPECSSVHGISWARTLEWLAISFFRGSSWLRDWTCVSCIAGRFFTAGPPGKTKEYIEKVKKHIKISPISIVIREMPINTAIRYHFTPTKITIIKERNKVSTAEHVEKQVQFSSGQLLSCIQFFMTLWTASYQASLYITNFWSLLKLMSIELMMPSHHLILCCPVLLLPSIFPSIWVFSSESALHIRWPKYWSFLFKISPSNEYSGPISFRMDWLDLLAVQGTLKSLFQHHSSRASILLHSAFFIVQLSHPYMTTGKTIALTRRTFIDKVMSLIFNMLSRLVITFLPRSKRLLISWLQSPSAVILEPRKIKSATISTVSPSISHEVMGLDAMILVFWMLSFKSTFHSPLSLSSRGSLVFLHFLP